MAKYTIRDFAKGDQVYHLSNSKLKMVVVEVLTDENEISCRWVDNDGRTQSVRFITEELGKTDDLRPRLKTITKI
ncbi:hypothetical protein K8352_16965 [Flavobacteriaceae bacterium F89]|uniref:DUF2158 domain-containing protein n=1 Tax=Cerina litoralis TaxID=2874477 RepID=A0AAE3EWM8_9FLAO|nr:hypothetical protein [Cerina litoralis]MCG2462455.1 hypothetical protein [Cerina litoralis]